MASGAWSLRSAALIATGAVAVHELRYLAAGATTDPGAGHGYLPVVGLLSTVLLAVACAQLAAVVERARRTGDAGAPGEVPAQAGLLITWLRATLALTLIFLAQESLEAILAGGPGAGLSGVVADGGWVALPIAGMVGAFLALALAGVRSAVAAVARGARRPARRRPSPGHLVLARGHRPAGAPLARHLAGRAPPCVLP